MGSLWDTALAPSMVPPGCACYKIEKRENPGFGGNSQCPMEKSSWRYSLPTAAPKQEWILLKASPKHLSLVEFAFAEESSVPAAIVGLGDDRSCELSSKKMVFLLLISGYHLAS